MRPEVQPLSLQRPNPVFCERHLHGHIFTTWMALFGILNYSSSFNFPKANTNHLLPVYTLSPESV